MNTWPAGQAPDADTLRRLRWRCRRGLLENDLFIERFFERHGEALTTSLVQGLLQLMDLSDNDLLDLLLARKEPEAELASQAEVMQVLLMMRVARAQSLASFPVERPSVGWPADAKQDP